MEDINQYLVPVSKKKQDYLIAYVGTNDAITNTSKKLLDDLLMLKPYR